jgi:type IVB pilus formation R64 PilN family outer membrane protein
VINPPFAKALLAIILSISVSGCEVLRVNDTMDRVDATMATTNEMAEALRNNKGGLVAEKSVVFTDGQYVSLDPIKLNQGLPFSSDCDITFNKDMSLQSFAQAITRTCNIKVQVTSDVYDSGKGSGSSNSGPSSLSPNGAMAGIFPVNSAAAQAPVSTSGKSTYVSGIQWEGKLSGLLDVATAQLGLSWKYTADDNTVSIYSLDTKTFSIFAFADETDMQSMVKSGTTSASGTSGSGGGGSGGSESGGVSGESGSSQSTSVSLKTSIIKDIENAIKAMLSNTGKMSMASSTGTVTVTDRPEVLSRIGRYLDAENKKLTQQILLNVKVFSVTLTDKDSTGIDWNLAYKAASATTGFNLSNSFSGMDTGAVTGNVGVLDGAFAGSTAIIKALSQQGKVSVVTSPSVTTLNLQPVPVQVARQTGYVASISTTNTANIGSTSSITPGTVTTGFNMDLLPSVMPNKELLLKYSINISSLIRIRSVSGGGADDATASHIEVPELDNRIFSQKVRLKSGSTLILSGFDQTSESGNKSGVGSSWNMMMGGGATRETNRDVIVVMITPVIQE